MDKVLLTGAVATTGGCSIVNGCSIQEMLLYLIFVLLLSLAWQVGYAAWTCWLRRKQIDRIISWRSDHVKAE